MPIGLLPCKAWVVEKCGLLVVKSNNSLIFLVLIPQVDLAFGNLPNSQSPVYHWKAKIKHLPTPPAPVAHKILLENTFREIRNSQIGIVEATRTWVASVVKFSRAQNVQTVKLGLFDFKWRTEDKGQTYRALFWGYLQHGATKELFAFDQEFVYPG